MRLFANNGRISVLLFFVSFLIFSSGCGGGKSDDTPAPPVPTTNLSGILTVPTTVNDLLLTSVRGAQNTDSQIRSAFASASVWVNDAQTGNQIITPSAVNPDWSLQVFGVPQSTSGYYRILVTAGKLGLKAVIKSSDKDSFVINSQTTAAALLSEKSGLEAGNLLASFPAMVSKVALQVETAFNASTTEVVDHIFNHPALQTIIASQANFLTQTKDFDPNALVAYLGLSNDLDGNGVPDLLISQTADRTGIRFLTSISSQTSLLEGVTKIESYTDSALFSDFSKGNTRSDRSFDGTAKNIALGLFLSKGATKDTYLKFLIKRVDLSQGTFNGAYVEYAFATATGTAVTTGTKTLLLKGAQPLSGAVEAADFISDGIATNGMLVYLDQTKGLGNPDSTEKILRAVDGQPELSKLSSAEPFSETTNGYQIHTQNALKAINKERAIEVGDVFSAYFKKTRHYALFKIKALTSTSVTLDYKVNSGIDEPRF